MSDWKVRKAARVLQPGDRFVFDSDLGGEGDVLTVESVSNTFGTVIVCTEEGDVVMMTAGWMVEIV